MRALIFIGCRRSDGLTFVCLHCRLVDGTPDTIDHYGNRWAIIAPSIVIDIQIPPGLELARLADLPKDALTVARSVSTKLKAQEDAQQAASESNATAARRKILLRVGDPILLALPAYEAARSRDRAD